MGKLKVNIIHLLFILFLLVEHNLCAQDSRFIRIRDQAWAHVHASTENPTDAFAKAGYNEQKARVYSFYAGILLDSFEADQTDTSKKLLLEAREYLVEAIALDANLRTSYILLGNSYYLDDKNNSEAMYWYKRTLQIDSGCFDAYYNLGIVFKESEEYEQAISYFEKAEPLDTFRGKGVYTQIGQCYEKLNFPEAAFDYYMKAIQRDSTDDYAYYALGLLYGKKKADLSNCVLYIEKAISANAHKSNYYEDLAVAYGFMKNYLKAIKTLEKGLRYFPEYAPYYHNLYITYKQMGQNTKANRALEKAKELAPEDYNE